MSPEELFNQILVYPLAYLVGLAVSILLGFPIGWILEYVSNDISDKNPPYGRDPKTFDAKDWQKKVKPPERGGVVLGYFERTLYYFLFLLKAYFVIIAWLAFKVASKWEVWQNITQVPSEIKHGENYDFTIWDRRAWSSIVLQRFNIGTLANILAGLIGVFVTYLILNY